MPSHPSLQPDCPSDFPLPYWKSAARLPAVAIVGKHVSLLPLDPRRHGAALFSLFAADEAHWEHLPYGPFRDEDGFQTWLALTMAMPDTALYVVCAKGSEQPLGFLGYRQITQAHGLVEIGHVNFPAGLRRTRQASEALYLLLNAAFEHGFRRCEWRCDSRNLASAKAARRLGFQLEGTLRQAMVVKGRNRDTQVHSLLDLEWGGVREALEQYLADGNFRADGTQLLPLGHFLPAGQAARDALPA